ncbi:MAG: cohesin domain-containing protein, partial [Oscillospiraceae bacterium]|nr:cohesin domain-containing protein [Oscillospiraceae bacterium]
GGQGGDGGNGGQNGSLAIVNHFSQNGGGNRGEGGSANAGGGGSGGLGGHRSNNGSRNSSGDPGSPGSNGTAGHPGTTFDTQPGRTFNKNIGDFAIGTARYPTLYSEWLGSRLIIEYTGEGIYTDGQLFDTNSLNLGLKPAGIINARPTHITPNQVNYIYDFSETGETLVTVIYRDNLGRDLIRYIPVTVVPLESVTERGQHGSITWNLNKLTGVLRIEGTGVMPNLNSSNAWGWFGYRSYISSVVISNGVESIGDFAFGVQDNISYENLTKIAISNSVTIIGENAFRGNELTSVIIPDSVISIDSSAFRDCPNLSSAIFQGNAPEADSTVFRNAAPNFVIYYYAGASGWTNPWNGYTTVMIGELEYIVKFVDWDDNELKSEVVPHGSAATAPDEPTREGYRFIGWDKNFSNVVDNMTIKARYVFDNPYAPQINVTNATGRAGEEITLTVTMENIPQIAGYGISMTYDPDVFTYISAAPGDILPERFTNQIRSNNRMFFSSYDDDGNFDTGTTLFTVTLKINENMGEGVIDPAALYFSYFNTVIEGFDIGDTIYPPINQPVITVINVFYGDVNGDGRLNISDRTRMNQFFSDNLPEGAVFIEANADVNGDGRLNISDRTVMNQFFAGTRDYLGPQIYPAFFSFILPAQAPINEPEIIVSNAFGNAGDIVSLTVSIKDNPGLSGYGISMRYDEHLLTFISASSEDILCDNFVVIEKPDGRIHFNSYNDEGEFETIKEPEDEDEFVDETILFTVTFKINETVSGNFNSIGVVEFYYDNYVIEGFAICEFDGITPKTIYPDIPLGFVTVEAGNAATIVNAVAQYISIAETSKNSGVWILSFRVTETYSNSEIKIVPYNIEIKANNANVDGRYDLGAYTLIYDIKGNGSNIREFRAVLK